MEGRVTRVGKTWRAMITGADWRLCRWAADKYNEFRHTTPEIQRLPRHSSLGNPARRGSAKYYTVQVRPFNQADSSYRPPHSPPRSGLFRLQGIFTAAGCAHSAWTIVCRTAGLAEEMPFKRLGHSSASYGIDLSGSTAGNTPEPVPPASATRKTYEDSLPDSMSVP